MSINRSEREEINWKEERRIYSFLGHSHLKSGLVHWSQIFLLFGLIAASFALTPGGMVVQAFARLTIVHERARFASRASFAS